MAAGFLIPSGTSSESLAMRRRLAAALMNEGTDTSPVQHWSQGAARMLKAGLGGYEMNKLEGEEKSERSEASRLLASAAGFGGGQQLAQSGPSPTPPPNKSEATNPRMQAEPQAQPQPAQAPAQGGNPRLAGIIQALSGNRHTAPLAQQLIAKSIEQQITPKYPSFGVIGKDQYGEPNYGWIDPRTRTVSPVGGRASGGGAPAAPGPAPTGEQMPPPPPGVDPRVWRKEWSENAARNQIGGGAKGEADLRGEIRSLPTYKTMAEVGPRFSAMVDASKRDNRASDVSLVFGLMKILDPTSVVRESEADMAANVATLPQNFRAQVNSFLTGKGRLAPEVRQALLQEAHGAASQYQAAFERDVSQYRAIAQSNKLRAPNVIPPVQPLPQIGAAQGGGAPGPSLQDIEAELQRRGLK